MTNSTQRRTGVTVCVLAVVLVVVGCSSAKANLAVKRAEKAVSEKQSAFNDAKSHLEAKTKAFCGSTTDYITALDRYGDLLATTTPTVGDVKSAGSDLAAPREAAISDAQAAVSAQEALVTAEKDLAKAEADLANARATASSKPATATPSIPASPAPLGPTATVNRVKQADTEFTAAQQGVTDQTPLVQASQQFNAAAVALEMSWLALFADAGCLTDEQQQKSQAAVHDYTVTLQRSLASAGYYQGAVDGVYGPSTVDAVEALQKAHGLPVTGTVDKATDSALQADLQAKGGAAAQQELASTAAVQQTLKLAGYWTGPVDGQWTPALTEALKKFQTDLGVKPTGTVDAATIAALEKAIAKLPQPGASGSSTPSAGSASPAAGASATRSP